MGGASSQGFSNCGVSPPPPCRPEQEMTVFPCQVCPDLINIAAAAADARGSHSAVTGAATAALQGSEVILWVPSPSCPLLPVFFSSSLRVFFHFPPSSLMPMLTSFKTFRWDLKMSKVNQRSMDSVLSNMAAHERCFFGRTLTE